MDRSCGGTSANMERRRHGETEPAWNSADASNNNNNSNNNKNNDNNNNSSNSSNNDDNNNSSGSNKDDDNNDDERAVARKEKQRGTAAEDCRCEGCIRHRLTLAHQDRPKPRAWMCAVARNKKNSMGCAQWNSGRGLPLRGVYPTPSHIGAPGPPETMCLDVRNGTKRRQQEQQQQQQQEQEQE